jgi:hypothetical protein
MQLFAVDKSIISILATTGSNIGRAAAHDCRNIHNPLWLPPTGTGRPPCDLQDPWNLDGRRAYYPQFRLASP